MKIKKSFKCRTGEKGSGIYFMSDLHYNHLNIIVHSERNFSSVSEMNSYILEELMKLGEDDIVFDLGDLFWSMNYDSVSKIMGQIKCKIYKVLGNHDNVFKDSRTSKLFESVSEDLDISIEDTDGQIFRLNLCHYPKISWNHKSRGAIHLHGHCHGNIDDLNNSSKDLRVDVGFDGELAKSLGKFIIDFKDIREFFNKKTEGLDYKEYVLNNCKNL